MNGGFPTFLSWHPVLYCIGQGCEDTGVPDAVSILKQLRPGQRGKGVMEGVVVFHEVVAEIGKDGFRHWPHFVRGDHVVLISVIEMDGNG